MPLVKQVCNTLGKFSMAEINAKSPLKNANFNTHGECEVLNKISQPMGNTTSKINNLFSRPLQCVTLSPNGGKADKGTDDAL